MCPARPRTRRAADDRPVVRVVVGERAGGLGVEVAVGQVVDEPSSPLVRSIRTVRALPTVNTPLTMPCAPPSVLTGALTNIWSPTPMRRRATPLRATLSIDRR
jgi:hypothetical protein